jgi:hypothetical protein
MKLEELKILYLKKKIALPKEVKSPIVSKINILNIYREKILNFAESRDINLNLMTFEEFEIK